MLADVVKVVIGVTFVAGKEVSNGKVVVVEKAVVEKAVVKVVVTTMKAIVILVVLMNL